MTLAPPLPNLLARLDRTQVEVGTLEPAAMTVVYTLTLPDGQDRRHPLRIEAHEGAGRTVVSVRETGERKLLPSACPERHINGDGTFCLGLPGVDEPDLNTPEGADRWWARLAGYLTLQALAEATGCWPVEKGWPHGLLAAETQHLLEEVAAFAPWLREMVKAGRIALASDTRVERRRAPCPCGSGHQTRNCHEAMLVNAAKLQGAIKGFEAFFYSAWTQPCCETMVSCGVRDECMRRSRC